MKCFFKISILGLLSLSAQVGAQQAPVGDAAKVSAVSTGAVTELQLAEARAQLELPASSSVSKPAIQSQLNTGMDEQLYFQQSGVCPVITDYLQVVCRQNPSDSACAPFN